MLKSKIAATSLICSCFLIAVAASMHFFSFSAFKKICFVFANSEIASAPGRQTVSFVPAAGIRRDQTFRVEIDGCPSPQEQVLQLRLNGRPAGEIRIGAGKDNAVGFVSGIKANSRNDLELLTSETSFGIERITIKNFSRVFHGLVNMALFDKPLISQPGLVRGSWVGVFFLLLLLSLLLLFRLKRREHRAWRFEPSPPGRWISGAGFGLMLLSALTPATVSFLSGGRHTIFFSQATFLLIGLTALAFLAYASGIALHLFLLEKGRRVWRPISQALERRGFDGNYALWVLLVPVIFFALFTYANWPYFSSPHQEFSDESANALQIERAKSFSEYLGPYSRFEFHHPGPVTFYYYAFMEKLLRFFPAPAGRHGFGQAILNFIFLLLALHIVYTSLPHRRNPIVLFFCFFFVMDSSRLGTDFFLRTWPPHLLIFPMLVFVLAIAKVSSGDLKAVLPTVFSIIVIVQNNISSIAVVGPFVIAAVVAYIWNKKKLALKISPAERKYLLVSVIILVIAFLPPLYEQFTGSPGNLTRIFHFFAKQKMVQHDFYESLDFVLNYYQKPLIFIRIDSYFLIGALWLLVALNIKKRRNFWNYLIFYLFFGLVLSIIGTMKITGPLMNYILFYEMSFVALLYFACFNSIAEMVRLPEMNEKAIFLVLILTAALMIPAFCWNKPFKAHDPRTDLLMAAIKPSKSVCYEMFLKQGGPNHDQWSPAVSLALQLIRGGYRVCAPDEWIFLFGRQLACRPGAGDVQRVAFYQSDRHTIQVRQSVFSYQDTTIEFGPMLPLPLPLHLEADAADDYFDNWAPAFEGFRAAYAPESRVTIPLGGIEGMPSRRWYLKISGRSLAKKKFVVRINECYVGEIIGRRDLADSVLEVDHEMLKPNDINVIRIVTPAGGGAVRIAGELTPAVFEGNFFLKSLTLFYK